MNYVSVCSGVEAATVAWKPLGWTPVWFSEIEPFPCEVLKYHYPDVPNLGDMTKIKVENLPDGRQRFSNGSQTVESEKVDLLVGGTPCFPEGTLVLTKFGYKEIEKLNIGDEVISHLGNVCKVTATGSKRANVGKIKVIGREKISCTSNHPFYVCWEDNKKSVKFDFTMAKHCTGKFAGRVFQGQELKDYGVEKFFIELAGYFIGCGKIKNNRICLKFENKKLLNDFVEKINDKIKFEINEEQLEIFDEEVNGWIKNNFFKEEKYCIPYFLYYYKHQDCFVKSFIEATEQSGKHKIYCRTKEIALGMADLFGNYDVKKDKSKDKWFICENKKTKIFGDRFASKVKEFKDGNDSIRTVYNITVEHDHSYIIEGLAVHNCQGFSLAGKQQGLNDERSGIALSYVRLLDEIKPRYFLWENVPGVFSTNDGKDFRKFLEKINEIGYCCTWRVLNSQYCRVDGFPRAIPQRRRRVFVVGCFGDDWQCPTEILIEPKILLGDYPPKRVKGKGFASNFEGSSGTTNKGFGEINGFNFEMWSGECKSVDTMIYGNNEEEKNIICYENHPQDSRIKEMKESCQALSARMGTGGGNLPLVQEISTVAFEPGIAKREGSKNRFTEEFVGTLRSNAGDNQQAVAIVEKNVFNVSFCDANGTRKDRPNGGMYVTEANSCNTISTKGLNTDTVVVDEVIALDMDKVTKKERNGGSGFGINEESVMYTQTVKDVHAVAYKPVRKKSIVRRLMPIECERLMGFDDNYTQIPWKGKKKEDCPDSLRYKACGNSMCVNVMRWIGKRIELVDRKRRKK